MTLKGNFLTFFLKHPLDQSILSSDGDLQTLEEARFIRITLFLMGKYHEHRLYLGFDAHWCWHKFVRVVSTGFVSLRRTCFFYSLWNVSPPLALLAYITSRDFSGKLVHAEVKGRRRKATKKCVAHDGCCFAWGPVAFCYNFREVYRTTGSGIWWDGGGDTRGVRTGDGLLFSVMSVFVMTVDTHPVL